MKKIKFSKDEGTDFYKELISKIDEHFRKNKIQKTGNNKMLFKIFFYFSLDIIFYILLINSDTLVSFYSYYFLMGISVLLTAFNISHDAAHGVAVKSKFWNKFLFQLSFNLQGNNAYVWGKKHNDSHHLYTNIEGSDIDVLNNPLVRMTETQTLKWYHKFQHIYSPFFYCFYSLNWFLFRDILMIFNISSRTITIEIPKPEVLKLFLFKVLYIVYMIIVPIYVLDFNWYHTLFAFLLNHVLISLIFIAVLGVSHLSDYVTHPIPNENGSLNMSWPKLQMCTSVDYNADSKFFNWTLGGFNAHSLHHLLPNICHVHYIDILPIFIEISKKYNITYLEMNYPEALNSHFRFLKQMGNNVQIKTRNYEK